MIIDVRMPVEWAAGLFKGPKCGAANLQDFLKHNEHPLHHDLWNGLSLFPCCLHFPVSRFYRCELVRGSMHAWHVADCCAKYL